MKKIWLILIAVVGVAVLGVGVYFALKKNSSLPSIVDKGPITAVNIPSENASSPRPKMAGSKDVFLSWFFQSASGVTSSEKNLFFLTPTGQVYKFENGREELISDTNLTVQLARPSADGRKILVKSGDVQSSVWQILDAENNAWQTLKAGVLAADFSPDAKRIVFLSNASAGRSDLIVKDLTASRQTETKIISLNQQDFDLRWTDSDHIFLVPKVSGQYPAELWGVNIKTKKINRWASGTGLSINWFPLFGRSIRFANEQGQPVLDFVNEEFFPLVKLNFKTLPEKCTAVSESRVFCAVPKNSDEFLSQQLPDGYLKKNFFTEDSIFYLDLSDRSQSKIIYEGKEKFDAVNLLSDGKSLYFINRYDNRLYSIAL